MNEESREEYVVRARGLPWSATAEVVAEFFSGNDFLLLYLRLLKFTENIF